MVSPEPWRRATINISCVPVSFPIDTSCVPVSFLVAYGVPGTMLHMVSPEPLHMVSPEPPEPHHNRTSPSILLRPLYHSPLYHSPCRRESVNSCIWCPRNPTGVTYGVPGTLSVPGTPDGFPGTLPELHMVSPEPPELIVTYGVPGTLSPEPWCPRNPCPRNPGTPGVTRPRRYYGPLRHPRRPGLSLTGVRLRVTHPHRMGFQCCVRSPFTDMPSSLPRWPAGP